MKLKISSFLMFLLLVAPLLRAQDSRTNHIWVDSLSVTTSEKDTLFEQYFQECSLWFDGAIGYIKIASPDTAKMADRKYIKLYPSEVLEIGDATKLRRIAYKGAANCTLFIVGYKYRYKQVK